MNVYDKARELAQALRTGEEYESYARARDAACANATTRDLLKQYHQLQLQAQAAAITGEKDETLLAQLQRLGEFLQMNADASAYLLAEYRLQRTLSEIYKILGEAVDVDLSALEG